MAHSFKYSEEVWFIYDGGMEGHVTIRKKNVDDPRGYEEIVVPATALVTLVAHCYVQPKLVARLEQATPDQLLGVNPREP